MNPLTLLPAFVFAVMSFSLVLAAFWMWNRRPPLSHTAAFLMLTGAGWVLAWTLALLSADLALKTTLLLVRFVAVASTPTLWFILALQYSSHGDWLTRRRRAALAAPLLVLLLLLLTNQSHEFIYRQIRLDPADPWLTLHSQHGPGFWVYIAYAYAMLVAGNLIVARMLAHSHSLYRRQAITLIAAALLPGFSGLFDIFLGDRLSLPLTPTAVAIACLTVSVTMIRLRRGDILSVALNTIIDGLSDGIVVVDNFDRVVNLNPAAQHLISPGVDHPVGQTIQHTWPALAETLTDSRLTVENPIEMTLPTSNGPRVFDVRLTALRDTTGQTTSRIVTLRDITGPKLQEAALHASEVSYRGLFNSIDDALYIQDQTGRFIAVNDGAVKMYGYPREYFLGQAPSILAAPDHNDQATVLARVQRAFAGEPQGFEFWGRRSNGEVFPKDVRLYPGTYFGQAVVVALATDITERKRAELRLSQLNECFLQFGSDPTENINRLVALCGEQFKATCALYNQLQGGLLCSLGHWQTPDDYEAVDQPRGHICYDVIQQAADTPLVIRNLESTRYLTTDPNVARYGLQTYVGVAVKWNQTAVGSLCVVFQSDVEPRADDLQFMSIIASAIGIEVERERAQTALRDSEARFRTLVESQGEGISLIDPDENCRFANPAANTIFGVDNLIGHNLGEFMSPEQFAQVRAQTDRRRRGERSTYDLEIVRPDGERRNLIVTATPQRDAAGDFAGALTVWLDITERKRAEEKLKASLFEKEVLLKEIHHRVKNNLQVVYSLLNLQVSQTTDAASLEVLRDSQNRVRSMALVHETLYRSPDLAQVDFAEYASNLAAHLSRSYRIDSAAIQFSVQAVSDVRLSIDVAVPCGLIINELVSNALKHAFPTGRAGTVNVRLAQAPDEQISITVADDGIGLPAGFDYTQTESLGMQLISQLVRQIHGRLTLQRDGGTQFTIEFQAR